MTRLRRTTSRVAAVTWAVCLVFARSTHAEEPSDPGADLRAAERTTATKEERLAAAKRLLAGDVVPDVDRTLRVCAVVLADDAELAGRLAMKALDSGWATREAREALWKSANDAAKPIPSADQVAIMVLTGDAMNASLILQSRGRSTPLLGDVLQRAAPHLTRAEVESSSSWGIRQWSAIGALKVATEDDPKVAELGFRSLMAMPEALPLLIGVAAPHKDAAGKERATPLGRLPRRVRAIVALGAAKAKDAVPVLLSCLSDREDGWVRVAAVDALGDIGDSRAVVPLCRILNYQGDRHRLHDAWEYPGATNTDVPIEAWGDVPYQAIDNAACDALLRLGVRNAAEWLIDERLEPRSSRWRIRVLQDAIDAIQRAFPSAPKEFEPDGGYPQRQAAVDALRAWFRTGLRLAKPLDEKAPVVVAELDALASSIGGEGVALMELQIAKRSAAIIGAPMTPSIGKVLAKSKRKFQRAELAAVLGTLRDRRAIAPLLDLTRDAIPAVRANAAESLAAYADPEFPGLLEGESTAGRDAIVGRWIEMLDDPDEGPRVSAIKALSSVPPMPEIARAIDSHRMRLQNAAIDDFAMADRVARLVQTGAGIDDVMKLLDHENLFRRRFVWELMRVALRLEPRSFDALATPGSPGRRIPDAATIKAAVEKRRAK